MTRGICAAGHPLTAEAGARALRAGGNAVDAAVAAMLTSWVAEPLLTGPGAGGYLLVAGPGQEPTLLDFFVAAPGHGSTSEPCELIPVDVDFGGAVQVFNVGAASCGVPGNPAGVAEAARRWGTMPLDELAAPAAALARAGVPMNRQQAFIAQILEGILVSTPESRAIFAPFGHALREGERFHSPELGHTIERLGAEGAAPFYTGDLAEREVAWVGEHGGTLTAEDLRRYAPVAREPVHVTYRGRRIMTNPPPNAGGVLLAVALAHLDAAGDGPPALRDIIDAMRAAQSERTPEFTTGLADEAYAREFVASRLGATTHISVMDGDGCAATVTCTNGEGSGLVVPGTGIHVNNIMGEEDLNPLGFHRAAPGTRMPSMMAPTVVLRDGGVELVLGSAGSNRIRSAILQTIVGVVDHGMAAPEAVEAPRVHLEDEILYTEPGVPVDELGEGVEIVRFRDRNVFFGGAQAVEHDPATGRMTGAGDPRRGGVAVEA